jgi:hypothetical protein
MDPALRKENYYILLASQPRPERKFSGPEEIGRTELLLTIKEKLAA